jgi:CarD family transcriptional regulator
MATENKRFERGEAAENRCGLLWGKNAMERDGAMMYQVNDMILYAAQGICRIAEITEMDLNGAAALYYVLKPVYEEKSTIFVPVYNETLTSKMRRVLSAPEIYALIKTMPDEGTIWIDNEKERRERYKEIMSHGDRTELVKLIKTLYLHELSQKGKGKKLYVADERFMKEAEKILYEEFAHVLNIKREQVLPFIIEQISVDER